MLTGNDKDCEITKDTSIEITSKLKEDDFGSQRVYKKASPNSVITLYLGTRDVICRQGVVEPLRGVIYIDPKFVPSHKIYGQLTLTFRYGREDEEVMGLKFCNEAIIALKQIWPRTNEKEELTSLQEALLARLGKNSYPFTLEISTLSPPSVQLIPAKRYNGAPIGTSYDIRVHMADQTEERIHRRCMVRLGVRVIHKITPEANLQQMPINSMPSTAPILPKTLRLRLSPKALKLAHKFTTANTSSNSTNSSGSSSCGSSTNKTLTTNADENQEQQQDTKNGDRNGSGVGGDGGGTMSRIDIERGTRLISDDSKGPEGSVDKPFLWTDGRVSLRAALDKSAYGHGEHISVTVDVRNDSRKIIRKIRIFAVQHVDVCMFSNGKFKNVVADINENYQIKPSERHRKVYSLLPVKGPTKNWIAVEGNPSINSTIDPSTMNYNYKIAASAPKGVTGASLEERNVFAIYVSYYIKVKLTLSGMGGEVTLKLPFILGHIDDNDTLNSKDKSKQCSSSNNSGNGGGGGVLGKTISTTLTTSKIVEEDCGGTEQLETTTSFEENKSSSSVGDNEDITQAKCSTSAIVCESGAGGGGSSGCTMYPINKNVNSNKHEIDSIKSDIISIDDDDEDIDDEDEITAKFNVIGQAKQQLDDQHHQQLESNVNVITAQVHNSAIQ